MTSTSIGDQKVDEMTQEIMTEIENKSSKELAESDEMIKILHLTDMRHAKTLLQHVNEAPTETERNVGKQALAKALLLSVWHQRLYFIVRSFIMGILGALLTLVFVLIFGSLNLILEIPLGIFSFIFTLGTSRLLDVQIVKATRIIIDFLMNHNGLRDFVLGHF
ncbi:MAG: hypothetical protein WCD81_12270 [Candidatus Bathyarchaeia archaeon]